MPKKTPNYENTVIYKIQHSEKEDLLYVGSTTDFTKRKYAHKQVCNNPEHRNHNLKLYQTICANGGWDSFKMLVVKNFPCYDKRQAEAEEDRIMRELKANLNMKSAVLDKIKMRQNKLEYRANNKDAIKNKEREYRENHREQYADHCKRYYKEHKQEIDDRKKELVQCQCGNFMRRNEQGKTRHQQSQKHLNGLITFGSRIV